MKDGLPQLETFKLMKSLENTFNFSCDSAASEGLPIIN